MSHKPQQPNIDSTSLRLYLVAQLAPEGKMIGRYRVIRQISGPIDAFGIVRGRNMCLCDSGHDTATDALECSQAMHEIQKEITFEQYRTLYETGYLKVAVN